MNVKRGYYDVFVKTCAKYPLNIAIRHYSNDKYKYYTYSELYGVCEYISQNLLHMKSKNGIIGIISKRNLAIPCVIAAAHKCCMTFMFVSPSYNIEAIAKELKFTIALTIENITDASINSMLFGKMPARSLTVFDLVLNLYHCDCNDGPHSELLNEPSYIAMTSGSTGEPKYVQVPIQCLQPNIDDLTNMFCITPHDIIYFSTPLTFDPSMVEVLVACASGASLLIAPDRADILFPDDTKNSITFWQTTPSKFLQFSNSDIQNKILSATSTLRILALGGEPLYSISRLAELKAKDNQTRLFTLYGVTEMSCWACVAELNLDTLHLDKEIPLGNCLSETELIIDKFEDSKSTGKIILLSKTRNCVILNKGSGNKEEHYLKFVDTGDTGENIHGTIYYRGRRDDVIKRFGIKVSLQHIETVVMQYPKVTACACVWLPKPHLLVLYYSSETIHCQDLSNFLKCKLNDRHWPDKVIRVDSLPTNDHGKISKIVLHDLYQQSLQRPQTSDFLKVIFLRELKSVLNIYHTFDEIQYKDFFSIGGTSFLAVSLCNKLSLIHPTFGNLILPYLLSEKNTIGNILNIAQTELTSEQNKIKKSLKSRSGSSSPTYVVDSPYVHKRPCLRSVATTVEVMIMWMYDTGKCVDASPSLCETTGRLFVTIGSHSGLIIVADGLTGELQGSLRMNSRIEASVLCCYEEPTGAYCGVVGAYDGTLVCFSLETAQLVWSVNVGSMIKSKGVFVEGKLYIASYDGKVRCINMKTGEVIRTIKISEQGISADLVPAKNEYLIVATLSGVCANIHVNTNCIKWSETLGSPVFANPVLYNDDKYVLLAEVNGEVHCKTTAKGITMWKYSGAKANIFSSFCVKRLCKNKWQVVFGCHDKKLYSLIVKNNIPSLHWVAEMSSTVYATPCELDKGHLLAASSCGTLSVFDSTNGLLVHSYQLPNDTFSSPVVYNNYLFIGCRNDHLYAIKYVIELNDN